MIRRTRRNPFLILIGLLVAAAGVVVALLIIEVVMMCLSIR